MGHILLTGAGFSYNWGGWLASEAFEYLIGVPGLDASCRSLLWTHKDEGFEKALSALQVGNSNAPLGSPLRQMEDAIRQMFDAMNRGFFSDDFQFEFMRPPESGPNSIAEFLARFDAIFTLNQDLLIEIGYLTIEPKQSLNTRWSAAELPGMIQRVQPPALLPKARWAGEWCPKPDLASVAPTNHHTQPIYKLHGSSNWVDETGARLLVMGGDKTGSIKGSKVLSLYMQEFERRLLEPDTRVMIIGYGFRDEHINGALQRAAEAGRLKAFIVDPAGADAPDQFRNRPTRLRGPDPEHKIQTALIGASRRSLGRTFGGDTIERDKVLRFFDP
ncbi:MAG: SIR2 family protein [Caulobacterales bacterium]